MSAEDAWCVGIEYQGVSLACFDEECAVGRGVEALIDAFDEDAALFVDEVSVADRFGRGVAGFDGVSL